MRALTIAWSRGIELLTAEGYDRDQAVAIAYRQCGTATKRAVAFLTGLEPEMQKKAFDGPSKEDWPERTKEARKAIEDVEDYEPEPGKRRHPVGEPANRHVVSRPTWCVYSKSRSVRSSTPCLVQRAARSSLARKTRCGC